MQTLSIQKQTETTACALESGGAPALGGASPPPPPVDGPDLFGARPGHWALALARARAGAAAVLGRRVAEAEDAAADAVLGIFLLLARGQRPAMPAWLVLCQAHGLGRRALDRLRRGRGRRPGAVQRVDRLLRGGVFDLEAARHVPAPAPDPEAALLAREQDAARGRALARAAGLPPAQRRAVRGRLAGRPLAAADRQALRAAIARLRRAAAGPSDPRFAVLPSDFVDTSNEKSL